VNTEEYIEHLKSEKKLAEELLAECAPYLTRGDVAQAELQDRISKFFGELRKGGSAWVGVDDSLPPVYANKYGQIISSRFPLLIDRIEGFATGYLNQYPEGGYFWTIEGYLGDFNVTHWLPIPESADGP
jgi:hypothetical protein